MASPDVHASSARPPGLESRQEDVITQTITHLFATITVLVTLGDDGDDRATAAPVTPTGGSALTPGPMGAVVGSVLGLVLLMTVLWACAVQKQRRSAALRAARRQRRRFYDGSGDGNMAEGQTTQHVAWLAARQEYGGVNMPGTSLNPPPTWIRPTRYTPYRQTRKPQIRGVKPFSS